MKKAREQPGIRREHRGVEDHGDPCTSQYQSHLCLVNTQYMYLLQKTVHIVHHLQLCICIVHGCVACAAAPVESDPKEVEMSSFREGTDAEVFPTWRPQGCKEVDGQRMHHMHPAQG